MERRRPWVVQTVDSGRPGPLWVVMHDDEAVAFDNAVHVLTTHGGVLITLETRGKRNQDGIDPNRNFSAEGVGCAKVGAEASARFTALFRERFTPGQPVIALHNNHDGRIPTGGLGHASMESLPKEMRALPASDESDLADDHTLVLLAALDPSSTAIERRAQSLNSKGINVVIEAVRKDRGDCSLSNDVVLTGHDDYFNVTVDAEDAAEQRQIIDIIMSALATVAAAR